MRSLIWVKISFYTWDICIMVSFTRFSIFCYFNLSHLLQVSSKMKRIVMVVHADFSFHQDPLCYFSWRCSVTTGNLHPKVADGSILFYFYFNIGYGKDDTKTPNILALPAVIILWGFRMCFWWRRKKAKRGTCSGRKRKWRKEWHKTNKTYLHAVHLHHHQTCPKRGKKRELL